MPKDFENSDQGPELVFPANDGTWYVFQVKPLPKAIPPDLDFSEQLREAIRASGLSQYQLAKAAQVNQPSVSLFLSGGDLKATTFNRLAYYMGFELRQVKNKAPKKKPTKK